MQKIVQPITECKLQVQMQMHARVVPQQNLAGCRDRTTCISRKIIFSPVTGGAGEPGSCDHNQRKPCAALSQGNVVGTKPGRGGCMLHPEDCRLRADSTQGPRIHAGHASCAGAAHHQYSTGAQQQSKIPSDREASGKPIFLPKPHNAWTFCAAFR